MYPSYYIRQRIGFDTFSVYLKATDEKLRGGFETYESARGWAIDNDI